MTFPTTPILDDFNRPDEGPPPGAGWATPAWTPFGLVVSGSECVPENPGGNNGAYWDISYSNFEFYFTMVELPSVGDRIEAKFRADLAVGDGFTLRLSRELPGDDDTITLDDDVSPVTYPVADFGVGDSFGVHANGSGITVYYRPAGGSWNQVIAMTSNSYSSGYIIFYLPSGAIDNFGGGALAAPAPVGTPSHHESAGLSIAYADPLVKAGRSALMHRLTGALSSWSHESRRVGGYWSASLSMADREEAINDWIQNGIGRHVEAHNPALEVVWEGFVNEISVRQGEDSYSVGPLVDIGNRVSVTYSVIDTSTDPPTLGTRDTTAVANNADSQALYGIWHKIKSINGATATDATQLRDSFVNDPGRAYPAVTPVDFSLGGGGDMTVTLSLLGYWHWLKAYYPTVSATGDQDLSAKITAILALSPNAIFSSNYLDVATNTTQVGQSAGGEQTAETILKDLNSRGDASNNAYSIGFYAGRQLIYRAIPTEVEYQKRRGQPVLGRLDNPIRPWDVDPARWIFRPDFLVGRHPPITAATLGSDPRAGLIEVVKYSTPYGLSVNGQKVSQLDQMLARRGIGGMS